MIYSINLSNVFAIFFVLTLENSSVSVFLEFARGTYVQCLAEVQLAYEIFFRVLPTYKSSKT